MTRKSSLKNKYNFGIYIFIGFFHWVVKKNNNIGTFLGYSVKILMKQVTRIFSYS